ncbi:MAG: methylated-DNA--[protein]-cysteine S-methyltransferase [Gemmatimonadetes bacterium]|jgi:methylated-DNA-[protein]-cysteine S-methyltransferase|nr:methylated-DNA--[protein]-cysteine S-methyltransferase [Gemmatimonadota bacterium]MBT4610263.1 methylated-DNA--[protein]-cysteine S-methyltransferase [Gemmatimonadota bacterium]MBT5058271.1 methylated-DNA--[protein]-cysteine S-methyltransferase [Gemmatimonadota bacterium]MBT5146630.1 methylated-DNA--[protein]-cysteine S-methyltransferase [Gemmatimonadota bacterium]MBT5587213.1 methylated-DNA--[protein]-cysteine S-methyltransferase [Gemmatimonadota bacterium]
MHAEPASYGLMASPVGELLLSWSPLGLSRIRFGGAPESGIPLEPIPFGAQQQLEAYFAGDLRQFDLPLDPHGTAFQLQVWAQLRQIPFGVTMTYGELAYTLGKPKASRAVGGANHHNPLPIVVPCHRVIGADGRLTGFASGLEIKQQLLDLERRALARPSA